MNYRDLQNISYLTQEILIENAGEEYNPMNRWPYTSPYLQEAYVDEERAPGVKPYKRRNLQPLPSEKPLSGEKGDGSGYGPEEKFKSDWKLKAVPSSVSKRKTGEEETVSQRMDREKPYAKRPIGPLFTKQGSRTASAVTRATEGPGEPQAVTMPRMKSKPSRKIVHHKKVIKDSYDLYDLILSHLLDEGYASSVESAEAIMVNMSEEWKAYLDVYLNESAAGDVADRAATLARQRKGQTPERKKLYTNLAQKAAARERGPGSVGLSRFERSQRDGPAITPYTSQHASTEPTLGGGTYPRGKKRLPKSKEKYRRQVASGVRAASSQERERLSLNNSYDLYDLILSHLLDEGYASSVESAEAIMVNMSEEWRDCIMEKEDSEYEKASDAALDSRYGYGRAQGDKRSFGRAANRSSAAAALRALRRGERSGSGTSTEAGADAVHQGWARTARTSADQTPEKKERRAKLADTSYSNLPDDEKEKDRVSFNAVKATYNRNK